MIYNREYNIQAKQKKNPKKTATIFFLRFFVNTQKHESHKKRKQNKTKQNKTKYTYTRNKMETYVFIANDFVVIGSSR